jgi:hypothetical protein
MLAVAAVFTAAVYAWVALEERFYSISLAVLNVRSLA